MEPTHRRAELLKSQEPWCQWVHNHLHWSVFLRSQEGCCCLQPSNYIRSLRVVWRDPVPRCIKVCRRGDTTRHAWESFDDRDARIHNRPQPYYGLPLHWCCIRHAVRSSRFSGEDRCELTLPIRSYAIACAQAVYYAWHYFSDGYALKILVGHLTCHSCAARRLTLVKLRCSSYGTFSEVMFTNVFTQRNRIMQSVEIVAQVHVGINGHIYAPRPKLTTRTTTLATVVLPRRAARQSSCPRSPR